MNTNMKLGRQVDHISRNPTYLNVIFMCIAVIGIIVRLILSGSTSKDGESGNATASVYGYTTTIISLVGFMFTEYAINDNNSISLMKFLKKLFIDSLPILSLIIVLAWNVQINSQYYKKINKGAVASEYNTYAVITNILSILQIIIIFKMVSEKMQLTNSIMGVSNNLTGMNYVLLFINVIFTGMMQIVVQYFSTDG